MEQSKEISVEQCCAYYNIETSFMQQLDEYGLIELHHSGTETRIAYEQLADLEKYMRLHYDLEINMAGIEAISHLLHRMRRLQQQLKSLEATVSTRF